MQQKENKIMYCAVVIITDRLWLQQQDKTVTKDAAAAQKR